MGDCSWSAPILSIGIVRIPYKSDAGYPGLADGSADSDASGDGDSVVSGDAEGSTDPDAGTLGSGSGVGSGMNRDGIPSSESTRIRRKIATTVRIHGFASRSSRVGSAPR